MKEPVTPAVAEEEPSVEPMTDAAKPSAKKTNPGKNYGKKKK